MSTLDSAERRPSSVSRTPRVPNLSGPKLVVDPVRVVTVRPSMLDSQVKSLILSTPGLLVSTVFGSRRELTAQWVPSAFWDLYDSFPESPHPSLPFTPGTPVWTYHC